MYDECAYRYIVRMKMSDASGGGWVNVFHEQAVEMLGIGAGELHELKTKDPNAYERKIKAAQFLILERHDEGQDRGVPGRELPQADRDEVPEAGLRGGEQEPAQAHGHRAARRINDGAAERSLKRFKRAETERAGGGRFVFSGWWRAAGDARAAGTEPGAEEVR